jgi:hypothetical protein
LLGSWVGRQRVGFHDGKLDARRQKKLEAVNHWTWNKAVSDWGENFDLMVAYQDSHNGSLPSARGELTDWINNQRDKTKNSRRNYVA